MNAWDQVIWRTASPRLYLPTTSGLAEEACCRSYLLENYIWQVPEVWPFLPWWPFCGTFLPSPPEVRLVQFISTFPKDQAMLLGLEVLTVVNTIFSWFLCFNSYFLIVCFVFMYCFIVKCGYYPELLSCEMGSYKNIIKKERTWMTWNSVVWSRKNIPVKENSLFCTELEANIMCMYVLHWAQNIQNYSKLDAQNVLSSPMIALLRCLLINTFLFKLDLRNCLFCALLLD